MITYPLNVAVRILTARNYFLPQGITYRLPRLPILTARKYLPQGISSLVSLLVSSFGILTVRILTVSNFLELLTAALPQGIPYLLAVSRNYNYSCLPNRPSKMGGQNGYSNSTTLEREAHKNKWQAYAYHSECGR